MKKIILSMISPLLLGVLSLPGQSAFALDKVNVTLPSKSFQFIIFPLAKERGYMKEEGIDLNIVVMASTPAFKPCSPEKWISLVPGAAPWSQSRKAMLRSKPCSPSTIRCCSG
jgi:hypothetical protein